MNATTKTTTTSDTTDTTAEPSLTFEQMYSVEMRRYSKSIVTWKVYGIDSDTADDLVSDSYERLWRLWSAVDGKPAGQQRAYLARIVVNRVNDYLRRLKLGRDIFMDAAEVEFRNGRTGDAFDTDTDSVSIMAYMVNGCTVGVDEPERVLLAQEELREMLDGCIGIREDGSVAAQRIRQGLLADAMGYSYEAIARVQGRSYSAIKMEMIRTRERVGAREPSYATARKPRIRKQAQEVAA